MNQMMGPYKPLLYNYWTCRCESQVIIRHMKQMYGRTGSSLCCIGEAQMVSPSQRSFIALLSVKRQRYSLLLHVHSIGQKVHSSSCVRQCLMAVLSQRMLMVGVYADDSADCG